MAIISNSTLKLDNRISITSLVAGMTFSNAILDVVHSLGHQLDGLHVITWACQLAAFAGGD